MAKRKRGDVRRDNDKRPPDERADPGHPTGAETLEPPPEPVDLRAGFPLLVRLSDYAHANYPDCLPNPHGEPVAAKVLPKLPDNWPPPAWESDVTPPDGSPATISQWIDCMIKSLAYVEDSQQRGGWSEERIQDAGSDTIRDAYRLVRHLRRQDRRDAPQEPECTFDAHAAIIELGKVQEWLVRGDGSAGETTETADKNRPATAHSDDFRSVNWFGHAYEFTSTQAACIKVLWNHWENSTPAVGEQTILLHDDVESSSQRLSLVFRNHDAWKTMIAPGATKGTFRLVEPI